MFSEFSEVSWKPGLRSPITKQESESMKKTANKKIVTKEDITKALCVCF